MNKKINVTLEFNTLVLKDIFYFAIKRFANVKLLEITKIEIGRFYCIVIVLVSVRFEF